MPATDFVKITASLGTKSQTITLAILNEKKIQRKQGKRDGKKSIFFDKAHIRTRSFNGFFLWDFSFSISKKPNLNRSKQDEKIENSNPSAW